jgi:hypothetical protein
MLEGICIDSLVTLSVLIKVDCIDNIKVGIDGSFN